jgi:hypothetical protein
MFERSKVPLSLLVFLVLASLLAGGAWGQAASSASSYRFPRIEPDPVLTRLAGDASAASTSPVPGTASPAPSLDLKTLEALSLYASGAAPADLSAFADALDREVAKAIATVGDVGDEYHRGEAILSYMHRNLLRRYVENQTRLDTLLRTGDFNCVSSAMLYMIIGRAAGLEVEGVKTPDHAFCTVVAGGVLVDVETTNRYGFDPGTKKEFTDSFGHATGFSYVPQHSYAKRTTIGDRELVSLILSNRISGSELTGRYFEAVPLGVDRYCLLGDAATKYFMIDRFQNYASSLNQGGRYAESLAFVRLVRDRWGEDDRYATLLRVLSNNLLGSMISKNDFQGARAMLADLRARGEITDADSQKYSRLLAANYLNDMIRKTPFDEALAEIKAAYADKSIGIVDFANFVVLVYQKEADARSKTQGALEAAALIDSALDLIPGEPRLTRIRDDYRYLYVVGVHNRFAESFNGKRYPEAKALIESALVDQPDSTVLKNDLALVTRTMAK